MEHPAFVLVCLSHFKRERAPFMVAWSRTLHSIPRGSNESVQAQRRAWIAALKWSRPAWQAAYEDVPLADVLEREAAARARAGNRRRSTRLEPEPAEQLALSA